MSTAKNIWRGPEAGREGLVNSVCKTIPPVGKVNVLQSASASVRHSVLVNLIEREDSSKFDSFRSICNSLDGRDFGSATVVQIGIISTENFESVVLHGR
jgi:hypothetical protein